MNDLNMLLSCFREKMSERRMTIIFHVRSQKHRGAGSAWIGCEICDAFAITNGFPDEGRLSDHATRIHGKVNMMSFLFRMGKILL